MEIKYQAIKDSELLEAVKIQWKYAMTRPLKTVVICIGFAIGFIVWGTLSKTSESFWNFKTSIGIAYAIMAVTYGLSLYQSRDRWITHCSEEIERTANSPIDYTFTEQKIIIKDSESYGEASWTTIKCYRTHNNFLFLYLRSVESTWLTINRNKMSVTDFDTLLSFISNKIPLKK